MKKVWLPFSPLEHQIKRVDLGLARELGDHWINLILANVLIFYPWVFVHIYWRKLENFIFCKFFVKLGNPING